MRVLASSLEAMAAHRHQYPEATMVEIAFAGRSNVGKSTFINTLTERKKLAYTSQTPGKTRTVNFYRLDVGLSPEEAALAEGRFEMETTKAGEARLSFRLVDLPGYGFAKAAKSAQEAWADSINEYLSSRDSLLEVLLLCDLRHEPTAQDKEMMSWLLANGYHGYVVATKADKVPPTKRMAHAKRIAQALGVKTADVLSLAGNAATQPFGMDRIRERLFEILMKQPSEYESKI